MATAPTSRRLNLTRDQLAQFLTDQQQIRQFELLFSTVDELQVIVGTDFEYQADTAAATANEALAQISALAQDTSVDDAVLNAKVQQALDAIPGLAQALELLALSPRQELGTIASQNSDNVNITGGLISGLDAPLPVASGGIGVTTAAANLVFSGPTAGAAAAPTFRSLVAADIPALTSGTSILYGNGSGGFSNVTIGTGVSFAGGTLSATGTGGTVTSVTGTSPVVSSGGTTPAISLASGYGDTQNPYASKTANFFLAAPNGSAGAPTFRAVVAADIPTLNQNTTGTAANVTGVVAIANGGSGQTTAQTAMNAFAGAVTSGSYLRGNGTNVVMATIQAADVPTLNQNTTGTASNVTGTVAIANGGTGATTAPLARTSLGATTVGSNFFTLTNPSAVTYTRINADNSISTLDAATFRTAIGAGTGNGTVTSVTASSPLASSGGATPNITVTGSALTKTDDTNVTMTLGGAPTTALLAAASMTLGWTGQLSVGRGGTGLSSLTAGYIPFGNGTSAFGSSANLFWDSANNRLGLGTTSPATWLHILAGASSSVDFEAIRLVNAGENGTYINFNNAFGSLGRLTVTKFGGGSSADEGKMIFSLATNSVLNTGMTLDYAGNLAVVGALSKGSGSFRIEHPLESMKETHDLVHSFVEAPQADLYYRGKVQLVNGKASVNIDSAAGMTDGTFEVLCRDVQCFTSNETDWDAVRGSVVGNVLSIECQNQTSTATVSWLVIGERKDKHMYETDWTDDNGKVIVEPLKIIEEQTERKIQ
jgi:hypothetical protein